VNVGTGRATTVLELAAAVAEAGGVAAGFAPVHEPPREGEVTRSCLDGALAWRTLGFAPRVPLVTGLRRTLEWVAETRTPRAAPAHPVGADGPAIPV
jgi:nucleoside-diphosphate-sugar epimerase